MVADANYGVPLAQVVTPGNRNDSPMLPSVFEKAEELYDWWEPKVAIADRGYDAAANHEWLDARGAVPIIHIRKPSNTKYHSGVYSETGVPTCLGGVPMEYVETDEATGKRLYICQEGGCHLKQSRKGGVIYCDDEVWEDPSEHLRELGKVQRNTPEWNGYYRKRQAIERVFKSMKQSRRLERHCVRGLNQLTLHTLMSTLTFQATALARVKAGEEKWMRWMQPKVA